LAVGLLSIRLEDPAQPDVVQLLRHGEAFSASLYPPESNHHLPLDALRRPEVRFLVARDAEGKALATGAFFLNRDWALIAKAGSEGVEVLRLETGTASHAALALYESAGFKRRGPFANYRPDSLSVFMERPL
jgi:putative acetyltransferase